MKLPSIGSIVSFPFKHPIAFATIVAGTTLVVQAVASLYLTEQEEENGATLSDRAIGQVTPTLQLSPMEEQREVAVAENPPPSHIHETHPPVSTPLPSLAEAGQMLASARVKLHPHEATLIQIKRDIAMIDEEVRKKSSSQSNRKEIAHLEGKKSQLLEQKPALEAQVDRLKREVEKLERIVNQRLAERPKSF